MKERKINRIQKAELSKGHLPKGEREEGSPKLEARSSRPEASNLQPAVPGQWSLPARLYHSGGVTGDRSLIPMYSLLTTNNLQLAAYSLQLAASG